MHNLILVARNTFGSTAISPLEKTGDPKPEAAMKAAVRSSSLKRFTIKESPRQVQIISNAF
jgi:hypothetical protein